LLQCGHTFCIGCLQRVESNSCIICPTCRHATNTKSSSLPRNYDLEGMLDSVRPDTGESEEIPTTYCTECSDNGRSTPATSYCRNCQTYLCEKCFLTIHNAAKYLQTHTREDIDESTLLIPKNRRWRRLRKVSCFCCSLKFIGYSVQLLFQLFLAGLAFTISFFVCCTAHQAGHALMAQTFGVSTSQVLVWTLQLYPFTKWLSIHSGENKYDLGLTELSTDYWFQSEARRAWITLLGTLLTLLFSVLFTLSFWKSFHSWYITRIFSTALCLWWLDAFLHTLPTMGIPILIVGGTHSSTVETSEFYYGLSALGVDPWMIQGGVMLLSAFLFVVLLLRWFRLWNYAYTSKFTTTTIAGLERVPWTRNYLNSHMPSGHHVTLEGKRRRLDTIILIGHAILFLILVIVVVMMVAWAPKPVCEPAYPDRCV